MVAQTPPTRFTLDPARVEEFLEDISSFEMSMKDVATKWDTTVGGLALFITSEDGLQTIATAELAAALRIRLTAINLLPSVVEAMGYLVHEYAREERRVPLENSLHRIGLLELKRRNACRAGTLIFKLAHFNPRPIKSYTVRPTPVQPTPVHPTPVPPVGGSPTTGAVTPTPSPHASPIASRLSHAHDKSGSVDAVVAHVGAADTSSPLSPVERPAPTGAVTHPRTQATAAFNAEIDDSIPAPDDDILASSALPANMPSSAHSFSSGP